MEEEKCSHLSQIDEELNFTLSKLQSMEIKESIRIVDSNILPPLKNSLEIKVPTSNFKKNLEKEIIEKELEQKPDPSISNIHTPSMLIINDKNNKAIAAEKSLSISPQKEASRIMNEKLMKEEPKSLGKYLNIVTKNRKQVNSEAQVLANRIALLKQEELKTLKKIKETKNKADEIYRLKKQNYERSIEVNKNPNSLTNSILESSTIKTYSRPYQQ